MGCHIVYYIQGAKTSIPKLREVMGEQNKDLLSRSHMLEIRPCSTIDSHFGSDEVWKSSETTEVF